MTNANRLAEQRVREYTSRLKRIDELLDDARAETHKRPVAQDVESQLNDLALQRDKLAQRLDRLRLKSVDNWRLEEIEKAGPLAVWDAVAQQLERLVERFEK